MHTIQAILSSCPHQVSACHKAKALDIDQALHAGIPFTALGGKRVRCREGLLRFKLGSDWRLLYQVVADGYVPCALVSRLVSPAHRIAATVTLPSQAVVFIVND